MLYAYDSIILCTVDENKELIPVSENELRYTNADDESADLNGAVLYEGKDIKSWAKKKDIAYPYALTFFKPVLFGENGKQYFVHK